MYAIFIFILDHQANLKRGKSEFKKKSFNDSEMIYAILTFELNSKEKFDMDSLTGYKFACIV